MHVKYRTSLNKLEMVCLKKVGVCFQVPGVSAEQVVSSLKLPSLYNLPTNQTGGTKLVFKVSL